MTQVEKKEFVKNMYTEFAIAVNYHMNGKYTVENHTLCTERPSHPSKPRRRNGDTVYGVSIITESLYPIPTDQGNQYKKWFIYAKFNKSTLTVTIGGWCPMMAYQLLCYGEILAKKACDSISMIQVNHKDAYNVDLRGAYRMSNNVKVTINRKGLNDDELAMTAAEMIEGVMNGINDLGIGTFKTVDFNSVNKFAGARFK